MTKAEQVVLDTLEHNALQWDATDPEQAGAFRDAANVLRELADQKTSPPVAAVPFPPTQEPAPEPVRPDEPSLTPDPNDQGAPANG